VILCSWGGDDNTEVVGGARHETGGKIGGEGNCRCGGVGWNVVIGGNSCEVDERAMVA